jgi:hypothetical protein
MLHVKEFNLDCATMFGQLCLRLELARREGAGGIHCDMGRERAPSASNDQKCKLNLGHTCFQFRKLEVVHPPATGSRARYKP